MNDPFFETKLGKLYHGDCLELLPDVPAGSVDMVLCDLPYGTTSCSWDKKIDLSRLAKEYARIITGHGAIVLTGQQPFVTEIINALTNKSGGGGIPFRHELIWEKSCALGFLNAKKMPLKAHENIEVFYRALPVYNPQMIPGKPYEKHHTRYIEIYHKKLVGFANETGDRYPRSVIKFNVDHKYGHPTAKPQALFEWLIKTYTNEGMLVLDNCIGSGTTAAACENLNRRWIGMEKEEKYCEITKTRLENLLQQGRLDIAN